MTNRTQLKNYTHSIMFHHFHGADHPKGQGSISGNDFEEMIDWLTERYNLLSADLYMESLEQGALKQDDICLSFDDALLCQADIAVPPFITATQTFIAQVEQEMTALEAEAKRLFNTGWN